MSALKGHQFIFQCDGGYGDDEDYDEEEEETSETSVNESSNEDEEEEEEESEKSTTDDEEEEEENVEDVSRGEKKRQTRSSNPPSAVQQSRPRGRITRQNTKDQQPQKRLLRSRKKSPVAGSGTRQPQVFPCPNCKKEFNNGTSVNRHLKWCKPKPASNRGRKKSIPSGESSKTKETSNKKERNLPTSKRIVKNDTPEGGVPKRKRGRPPRSSTGENSFSFTPQVNTDNSYHHHHHHHHDSVPEDDFMLNRSPESSPGVPDTSSESDYEQREFAANAHQLSNSRNNRLTQQQHANSDSAYNQQQYHSHFAMEMEMGQQEMVMQAAPGPVTCQQCGMTYRTLQGYQNHVPSCQAFSSSEEDDEDVDVVADDVHPRTNWSQSQSFEPQALHTEANVFQSSENSDLPNQKLDDDANGHDSESSSSSETNKEIVPTVDPGVQVPENLQETSDSTSSLQINENYVDTQEIVEENTNVGVPVPLLPTQVNNSSNVLPEKFSMAQAEALSNVTIKISNTQTTPIKRNQIGPGAPAQNIPQNSNQLQLPIQIAQLTQPQPSQIISQQPPATPNVKLHSPQVQQFIQPNQSPQTPPVQQYLSLSTSSSTPLLHHAQTNSNTPTYTQAQLAPGTVLHNSLMPPTVQQQSATHSIPISYQSISSQPPPPPPASANLPTVPVNNASQSVLRVQNSVQNINVNGSFQLPQQHQNSATVNQQQHFNGAFITVPQMQLQQQQQQQPILRGQPQQNQFFPGQNTVQLHNVSGQQQQNSLPQHIPTLQTQQQMPVGGNVPQPHIHGGLATGQVTYPNVNAVPTGNPYGLNMQQALQLQQQLSFASQQQQIAANQLQPHLQQQQPPPQPQQQSFPLQLPQNQEGTMGQQPIVHQMQQQQQQIPLPMSQTDPGSNPQSHQIQQQQTPQGQQYQFYQQPLINGAQSLQFQQQNVVVQQGFNGQPQIIAHPSLPFPMQQQGQQTAVMGSPNPTCPPSNNIQHPNGGVQQVHHMNSQQLLQNGNNLHGQAVLGSQQTPAVHQTLPPPNNLQNQQPQPIQTLQQLQQNQTLNTLQQQPGGTGMQQHQPGFGYQLQQQVNQSPFQVLPQQHPQLPENQKNALLQNQPTLVINQNGLQQIKPGGIHLMQAQNQQRPFNILPQRAPESAPQQAQPQQPSTSQQQSQTPSDTATQQQQQLTNVIQQISQFTDGSGNTYIIVASPSLPPQQGTGGNSTPNANILNLIPTAAAQPSPSKLQSPTQCTLQTGMNGLTPHVSPGSTSQNPSSGSTVRSGPCPCLSCKEKLGQINPMDKYKKVLPYPSATTGLPSPTDQHLNNMKPILPNLAPAQQRPVLIRPAGSKPVTKTIRAKSAVPFPLLQEQSNLMAAQPSQMRMLAMKPIPSTTLAITAASTVLPQQQPQQNNMSGLGAVGLIDGSNINRSSSVPTSNPNIAVVRPMENPLQKLTDQISQIETTFMSPQPSLQQNSSPPNVLSPPHQQTASTLPVQQGPHLTLVTISPPPGPTTASTVAFSSPNHLPQTTPISSGGTSLHENKGPVQHLGPRLILVDHGSISTSNPSTTSPVSTDVLSSPNRSSTPTTPATTPVRSVVMAGVKRKLPGTPESLKTSTASSLSSNESSNKSIKVTLKRKEGGDSYSINRISGSTSSSGTMKSLKIKGQIKSGDQAGITTDVVVVPCIHAVPVPDPDAADDATGNRTIAEDSKGATSGESEDGKPPNGRMLHRAVIVYEVQSNGNVLFQSSDVRAVWSYIFETVQGTRVNHNLPPLPYPATNISLPRNNDPEADAAFNKMGLTHRAVQFLLEQLPGIKETIVPKKAVASPAPSQSSKAEVSPPVKKPEKNEEIKKESDTDVEEPVEENKSGCTRTERFLGRKPFDMFGWLSSKHRKSPVPCSIPMESATSLAAPLSMRFRKLKERGNNSLIVWWSKIHGRGLITKRDIEKGEMIIEYAGEVIRPMVGDIREKYYESKSMGCYMFRVNNDQVIDATMRGNAARFINHSCEPNCVAKTVKISGKDHILIFALKRIERGTELTYDYKFEKEEEKIPCSCQSSHCRKYLN